MNYKKAIDTLRTKKKGGGTVSMSYSAIAKAAGINESGFYQSMAKENPDFGWKQLLKISNALGVTFPRLARQAIKEGEAESAIPEFEGKTAEELTSKLTIGVK